MYLDSAPKFCSSMYIPIMYVSILTIARVTRLGEFTQIEMFLGNLIKFKITQILGIFSTEKLMLWN
jgi:uncharacterized membrane protein